MRYQYCEWASRAEDIMAADIKAIVHDVQDKITENGWMGAMKAVVDLGKKQFKESWHYSKWGRERQQKLDELNRGRH